MHNKMISQENFLSGLAVVSYKRSNGSDLEFLYVSEEIEDLCGYSASDLINNEIKLFENIVFQEDRIDVMKTIEESISKTQTFEIYYRICHANGKTVWVFERGKGECDEKGQLLFIAGIIIDITERIEAENKLKLLQKTVEQAPNAIVITEPDGTICFVNKSFLEITGYSQDEVLGKNPRVLKLNMEANVNYDELWKTVLAGNEWRGLFQNKRKNGEEYWERASIAPMFDNEGKIIKIIGIKEDFTKEHAYETELERLSRMDMLTNISNRRNFLEMAENEFLRNKRYPQESAFLMLDLDHFKRINDEFGHCVGDMALKEFANVCAKTIRTTDIIGRLGGEEFGIYLINTNYEDACAIVERLLWNVGNIKVSCDDGVEVRFTVSIGITKPLLSDVKLGEVLKRADGALYQAKNNGRNRGEWLL